MRMPPDGKRSAVPIVYKDAVAAKNVPERNVPDPMYARRFESMFDEPTLASLVVTGMGAHSGLDHSA
jgi:hypothetical protein